MVQMKEKMHIITTERLELHKIEDKDFSAVIDILTDEEVGKTYMVPPLNTPEEQLRLFDTLKRLSSTDTRFVHGIYLKNDLIGLINDVGISDDEIELGYVISPRHKSQGYMTEALGASIKELHRICFIKVRCGAFSCNAASMRVMEKCGMKRIDITENIEYRGENHVCIFYESRI